MNSEVGLVCNMNVFTSSERDEHLKNTARLAQSIQNVQEIEQGYELVFPAESEILSMIADFISKERLCCPFLDFTVRVPSNTTRVKLSISGPEGTPEFLRNELEGVF